MQIVCIRLNDAYTRVIVVVGAFLSVSGGGGDRVTS